MTMGVGVRHASNRRHSQRGHVVESLHGLNATAVRASRAMMDGVEGMRIVAMTPEYAADLVTWRHPAPYDCYDLADAEPEFFLDPGNGFFALESGGELIGFRSFGADGRVPGGAYDDGALDTGGGLRPSLTGQGLGRGHRHRA